MKRTLLATLFVACLTLSSFAGLIPQANITRAQSAPNHGQLYKASADLNEKIRRGEGSDLVRYWHDNSNMKSPWQRGEVITNRATGPGCIIQGDFRSGANDNFEVVVPEGNELVHYWHDNSDMNSPWQRSEVITTLR